METKANYVAVGAFVLACIVALVVAVLWLVGAQYSQEFAYYETHFTGTVTGLSKGTTVRYNGIEVGRVEDLDFDPDDPRVVIATLQVDPHVRMYNDSVASIESQGLAGGSYVEIRGGTKESGRLKKKSGERYPVIKSKPSSLQELFQGTPELIGRLNIIAGRLAVLLDEDNLKSISTTFANLRDITNSVNKHTPEMEQTLANLATASRSVDQAAKSLDRLATNADRMLTNGGPQLISETRQLVASLTRLANKLEREPNRIIFSDKNQGYRPR
ncbi:MAG: MlaD family protein [Alphaproteobacteria bacterium]